MHLLFSAFVCDDNTTQFCVVQSDKFKRGDNFGRSVILSIIKPCGLLLDLTTRRQKVAHHNTQRLIPNSIKKISYLPNFFSCFDRLCKLSFSLKKKKKDNGIKSINITYELFMFSFFFKISLILANKHCYRIIVINNIYVVCDTFVQKVI